MYKATAKDRARVREVFDGASDKIIAHKDGTMTIRFGFFYRHGGSAEKSWQRVWNGLAGKVELVEAEEVWQAWPKDSYWAVRFRIIGDLVNANIGDGKLAY